MWSIGEPDGKDGDCTTEIVVADLQALEQSRGQPLHRDDYACVQLDTTAHAARNKNTQQKHVAQQAAGSRQAAAVRQKAGAHHTG